MIMKVFNVLPQCLMFIFYSKYKSKDQNDKKLSGFKKDLENIKNDWARLFK